MSDDQRRIANPALLYELLTGLRYIDRALQREGFTGGFTVTLLSAEDGERLSVLTQRETSHLSEPQLTERPGTGYRELTLAGFKLRWPVMKHPEQRGGFRYG